METGIIENQKTIFAGTKEEFLDYVAKEILADCRKKESEFKRIDFGSTDCTVNECTDMQKLYDGTVCWYGITVVPNYFDASADRQFIADYYGGGSFGVCNIYTDDMDIESVKKDAAKMLKECLNNSDSTIVWEYAE